MVKQQLGTGPDSIDVSNLVGVAVTYQGFPEELDPSCMFFAVCLSSDQLPTNPYCCNLTSINGQFGKSTMTKDQFVGFYQKCGDDPNFNFNL
nr:unnamed protein product [Haemonchus contortus]